MGVDKKVSKNQQYILTTKGGICVDISLHHVIDPRLGRGGGGYRSFSFNEICSQQTYYLSMRFPSPVCTKCIRE